MSRLVLIILVIRLLAIGQVLLIALVIGRGQAPRPIRIATAALLLCTCAYLTLQTPMYYLLQGPLWPLLPVGAQLVPLMLWIFAHVLFERRIDWRIATLGGAVALSCWILLNSSAPEAITPSHGRFLIAASIQRSVQLLLIGHAMLIALAERGDDLIEKRRRLRVGFVVAIAALAVMVILFEFAFSFSFENMPKPAVLIQAIAILAATTSLGAALLQSDAEILFDPDRPQPEQRFSPTEHVLNQKLQAAMASGGYRETGLTIGDLAQQLGTPEHRLRALINQRLGYRNFSAFLNHHRIGDAKALLADPDKVDLPVLTIAMDLGYGSLPPFNRAFRETVGQAPSEFRRAAILPK